MMLLAIAVAVHQNQSSMFLGLLLRGDPDHGNYSQVMAAITELLQRQWQVQLLHVFRDANHSVDRLASHAYSFPIDLVYVDNSPPDCLQIL